MLEDHSDHVDKHEFGCASHARDPASWLGVSGQLGIPWGRACQEVL